MKNRAIGNLYPFLAGERRDDAQLAQALLESVRQKAADSVSAKQNFFDAHAAQVVTMAQAIAAAYRRGGRLYTRRDEEARSRIVHAGQARVRSLRYRYPVCPTCGKVVMGRDGAPMRLDRLATGKKVCEWVVDEESGAECGGQLWQFDGSTTKRGRAT